MLRLEERESAAAASGYLLETSERRIGEALAAELLGNSEAQPSGSRERFERSSQRNDALIDVLGFRADFGLEVPFGRFESFGGG